MPALDPRLLSLSLLQTPLIISRFALNCIRSASVYARKAYIYKYIYIFCELAMSAEARKQLEYAQGQVVQDGVMCELRPPQMVEVRGTGACWELKPGA